MTSGLLDGSEKFDEFGLLNRRALQLLVGAGIAMLSGFSVFFPLLLGVFIKPIANEFGWSRGSTALLITLSFAGMTIAAPLLPTLIARLGPRGALVFGYCVLVTGLVLFGVLPGILPLYCLVAFVAGLGSTITTPGGLILIITNAFDRRLGVALGSAMTGLGLGALFMPIIAEKIMGVAGWRTTYLALAGIAAALGVIATTTIFTVIEPRVRMQTDIREGREQISFGAILMFWRFWIIGGALFATTLAATGAAGHMPAALGDRGLSSQDAALGAGLIGLGILVGRLGAAVLMDFVFAPLVVLACFMLGAVGFLLVINAPADAKYLLLGGASLIGLVTGSDGDIGPILSRRYFGPEAFERVFGLLFAIWGLGAMIGPWLAGLSYDATGSYRLFMTVAAILSAASGATMLLLGRYQFAPASAGAAATASH
jgi:MFS transporter, OFA family, oxalate/formate antiporter